ncbi:hypothetical protein CVV65_01635 [Kyrpidia spormannii]|uniref:Uncharacterized protein n=1 Tax=Kyrpidia spormannii TaxID=2055160 RepID=A0A2K8N2S4_9BACL|nr:hypothetical protein [Kyrpidia spormannii]ATY83831.1 hypothetical protein CVV65_01635 [Kyrpidia spormannii]
MEKKPNQNGVNADNCRWYITKAKVKELSTGATNSYNYMFRLACVPEYTVKHEYQGRSKISNLFLPCRLDQEGFLQAEIDNSQSVIALTEHCWFKTGRNSFYIKKTLLYITEKSMPAFFLFKNINVTDGQASTPIVVDEIRLVGS